MRKLKKLFMVLLCIALFAGLSACGKDASDSSDSGESTSSEDLDEDVTLTNDDGDEVIFYALNDSTAGCYGYYICEADGSVWTFGGDILAVAYEEDGQLETYVCNLTFYMTEPEDDGSYYFAVGIENVLENSSTYWYLINIVDEENNDSVVGLMLMNPLDSDVYIELDIYEFDSSSASDKNSTSEETETAKESETN